MTEDQITVYFYFLIEQVGGHEHQRRFHVSE